MHCLRFSIFSDCSCECCNCSSSTSGCSKVLPSESCMFSCASPIDSVDSLGPFRCFKQMLRHMQTSIITNGVPTKTAINKLVPSIFFESHAPVVQFLSSSQHCPVEQSPFV